MEYTEKGEIYFSFNNIIDILNEFEKNPVEFKGL